MEYGSRRIKYIYLGLQKEESEPAQYVLRTFSKEDEDKDRVNLNVPPRLRKKWWWVPKSIG